MIERRADPAAPVVETTAQIASDDVAVFGDETCVGGLSLTFHRHFDAIAPLWRTFERTALCTPYQRCDWLRLWQEHIGVVSGIAPFVVTVRDRERQLVAILPFGIYRRGPVRIAGWLGDRHMNYFMGVFSRRASVDRLDWPAVMNAVARAAGIDVFVLQNQPAQWRGQPNPIQLPGSRRSPSPAFSAELASDFQTFVDSRSGGRWKRQLRSKAAKLENAGVVEMGRAESPDIARTVLESYFVQKAVRLARQGIPDPFSTPHVQAFFRAVLDEQDHAAPLLELYSLKVDGEVVAVYGGSAHRGHFSTSICSIAETGVHQFSPGEQLLRHMIGDRIARADRSLDLGIGASRTKTHWSDGRDELFDTLVPVTALGSIAAYTTSVLLAAKTSIKENPKLWESYSRLRKWRSKSGP